MQENKIEIYTDGSCLGNPGPGGWGAIIFFQGKRTEISGGEPDTTNNRMEMQAIIEALKWLRSESGLSDKDLMERKILLYSDSNLLMKSLTDGWKRKANIDLWGEIDRLRAWLDIEWTWVKAHAKNKYNNLADSLAFSAAQKQKASF